MAQIIRTPRGTFDILPEDMLLWYALERSAREAFARYGYGEIRTPLLEATRLFARGIGDTTDIVEKEMYTFEAKGRDESMSLRPEGTAGVVRAYIEHGYAKTAPLQKLWYMGPMFRYERPQAGRQRQFTQIGVEVLGTNAPEADVETIALALDIFAGAGLSGVQLKLNSIGCAKCRPRYKEVLQQFLSGRVDKLCGDCKRRYDKNILRVLDCKQDACRALIADVPEREAYLCEDCAKHFAQVKALLDATGISYVKDKFLVRGFDYYTRTVYEIAHSALGARDAVGGGGRYDNLVEELGGPATGAVGFSIGMEATLLALKNSGQASMGGGRQVDAFLIVVDEAAKAEGFKGLQALRAAGVSADTDFEGRSIKSQMRTANKLQARAVVIIGPEELAAGKAKVKNMSCGEEKLVSLAELPATVKAILGK
jgi:histidyl-tRNA synthetase